MRPAALLSAASSRLRKRTTRYVPPSGLSIPLVTILDSNGQLLEDDQRSVVRYTIQQGAGANILFAAGTTGEWNRVDNAISQAVAQIVVEECHRRGRRSKPVEAWVGITAHTAADTIANLEHAIAIGADAVVVAPLSISDAASPVEFIEQTMGSAFDRIGRTIPVFLYDNAEIAAAGKAPHLHTREVKRISQLPWVYGVKVTAGKAVLGNYTRAASHFKRKGEFAIYPGNAYLIFDLFRPAKGVAGRARNYWNRYLTRNSLPSGVVCGAANVFPREWQRSWQICSEHELPLMERYGGMLEQFADICEFTRNGETVRLTIACTKAALKDLGVCSSDAVAPGTPAFEGNERREFLRRFRELRRRAAATLEPEWLSAAEAGTAKSARVLADA
ncbi:MAG TPA: dihydrodipicolinate synthase family protein [Candidatus Binataceae bacterium]|nr:dihydrodipicolinate synthase family protein [Candidatus Binataceae bacterium]